MDTAVYLLAWTIAAFLAIFIIKIVFSTPSLDSHENEKNKNSDDDDFIFFGAIDDDDY